MHRRIFRAGVMVTSVSLSLIDLYLGASNSAILPRVASRPLSSQARLSAATPGRFEGGPLPFEAVALAGPEKPTRLPAGEGVQIAPVLSTRVESCRAAGDPLGIVSPVDAEEAAFGNAAGGGQPSAGGSMHLTGTDPRHVGAQTRCWR